MLSTPIGIRTLSLALRGRRPLSGFVRHLSEDSSESEFGFSRMGFKQDPLVGTVQYYDHHVFLQYKNPEVWPPHIEKPEFGHLPWLLSKVLMARKGDISRRTRFTICEEEDSTESSNDVLIFPDMIRYRHLTHLDVENFVENTLVNGTKWLPQAAESLTGSYIFVCSHGSRDKRCGFCGPSIVKKFKEEIQSRCLQDEVHVSPCSHIGGHKYAGNVIMFGPCDNGKVVGHWYGYVSPEDVSFLLDQHIIKGQIIPHLWRGQMGLSVEQQKKFHSLRLQHDGGKQDWNSWKGIHSECC